MPIRLLGIQVAKLRKAAVQLPLFDEGERRVGAVDRIRGRFGYHAVRLGSSPGQKSRRTPRKRVDREG